MSDTPRQATPEELCAGTLEHYERLADLAHHWSNQVPQAIKFWYLEKPKLEAALSTERSAREKAEGYVRDAFDAIFPYIPDACNEEGEQYALAGKIRLLAELVEHGEIARREALSAKEAAERVNEVQEKAATMLRAELAEVYRALKAAEAQYEYSLTAIRALQDRCEAAEREAAANAKDAERWRVLNADGLTYSYEPLFFGGDPNRQCPDMARWTVWWNGPKKALFQDAIDAAILSVKEQQHE